VPVNQWEVAMTDDELMAAFERGAVPAGGFHHEQHVRAAWHYLKAHALPEALGRFCSALRAFAIAQGAPNLYHETITVSFVLLINERLARPGAADSWEAFASDNPDLLSWKPSILDRYYRRETLESAHARRVFVMPDRGDDVRRVTVAS
jgi:hypothetical protein